MNTDTEKHIPSEDLEIIRMHGLPAKASARYVTFSHDGSVAFTPRGRQLYRMAFLLHGMDPEPIELVSDVEDLLEVTHKLRQVRMMFQELQQERDLGGGVPLRAHAIVDAMLHGTAQELHVAVERQLQSEAERANVVPVDFVRRKRRKRIHLAGL